MEQEGYIYPVKGKGNFVNGNLVLRQRKKEACFQKLEECLTEGREFGITAEDCLKCLRRVYGEVDKMCIRDRMKTRLGKNRVTDREAARTIPEKEKTEEPEAVSGTEEKPEKKKAAGSTVRKKHRRKRR